MSSVRSPAQVVAGMKRDAACRGASIFLRSSGLCVCCYRLLCSVGSRPTWCCGAAWEPTLVNLGHVFRKQRRWADAVGAFQQALGLCPGQPGTYAALGYTHHLQARVPSEVTPGDASLHCAMSIDTWLCAVPLN